MQEQARPAARFQPRDVVDFAIVGLGFAGALKDIGLPQKHLAVALLTFNIGVELGQLLVVAISFAIYRALSRQPQFGAARTAALYAVGSVAAYWSITRIAAIVM